jgi:hypothetical protein
MDTLKIEINHPIGNPFKQIKNNWKIIQHQRASDQNQYFSEELVVGLNLRHE